ncbi:hypothetical protein DVS28_a0264 [Euzebya pacifica]|uniref:Uncharacterized protein n=1 Tax=Euzebya pacifica TaxID=1608957 RepID=A0A346XRX4_9ACTN|nr:hypothetical protein DVS28_a0264 [Euzebya pacifica]
MQVKRLSGIQLHYAVTTRELDLVDRKELPQSIVQMRFRRVHL